jgi:hypothetical protein
MTKIISFAHSPCLLPDDSAGRDAEELWWTNQEFSSVDIIPPCITMDHHVFTIPTGRGKNRPVGAFSSQT